MANEWQVAAYPGLTVYGRIRQQSTGFWRRTDSEAFEAYNGANWLLYVHALAAEGADRYVADLPAGLAAGYYGLEGRLQSDGAAVELLDGIIAEELGYWTGSAWVPAAPASLDIFGQGGSVDWVYTVYQPDEVTPLAGCAIYVSSDAAGTNRSETQMSDSLGRVFFALNPGTVYVWRSHPGYLFEDDPDEELVEP